MKSSVILLISVISVGSCALGAAAEADKNRELSAINAKIQIVGADIRNISTEKSSRQEELKKLEKLFGEFANALIEIKAKIRLQEDSLQEVRSKINATQKELQFQRHGLEGLVKAAYAIGNNDGLKVILNQRDPSSSGRMLVYRDYISKARAQKLLSIQESFTTLYRLEEQIEIENQAL